MEINKKIFIFILIVHILSTIFFRSIVLQSFFVCFIKHKNNLNNLILFYIIGIQSKLKKKKGCLIG